MQLPDSLTGLAVAALGVLTVFGGYQLPPMAGQEVGPSAFPILIGIGLITSGVLIALGIGHRFEEEAEAALAAGGHPPAPPDRSLLPPWFRLAVPPALLLLYVAVADWLGFVPTAALMVLVASLVMGARLCLAVPLAILAPLVVHLVFSKLLRVALPPGLLPIPW